MKTTYTLLILFLLSIQLNAQKEMNWWYFGTGCGLNFNGGTPTAMANGAMNHSEGSATISSAKTGMLLFYSDGIRVWNKNHQQMPNGNGLNGSTTSSHSACIIPWPGDTSRFVLVSIPYPAANPKAAEINMALDGGLGDVDTSKDVKGNSKKFKEFLSKGTAVVTDKVAYTRHENKIDYWVLFQEEVSGTFHATKVTSNGIDTNSVMSAAKIAKVPTFGCMKFSPNGKKLAVAYGSLREVHLYDFNSLTGIVDSLRTITFPEQDTNFLPYGIEFSPNSKYLYVSSYGVIQFNTSMDSSDDISNSGVLITKHAGNVGNGHLQLGPDKKVYFANSLKNSLDVIESPNNYGPYCRYKSGQLSWFGLKRVRLGLPTFNNKSLGVNELELKDVCIGDTSLIQISDSSNIDSVLLNYGDPSSGVNNIGRKLNSFHYYNRPGVFAVTAVLFRTNNGFVVSDTIVDSISVFTVPRVTLGSDTVMCFGDSIEGEVINSRYSSILWNTGEAGKSLKITRAGEFILTATNECGSHSDRIKIIRMLNEGLDLGPDTVLCPNQTLYFDVSDTLASYRWDNGLTRPTRMIRTPGKYWAETSNFCGVYSDTLNVDTLSYPTVNLGPDTSFCDTNVFVKIVTNKRSNYFWQDSSNLDAFRITQTGKYWVEVKNQCGVASDTFEVIAQSPISFKLSDTTFCSNDSIWIEISNDIPNVLWHNGAKTHKLKLLTASKIWCNASNACGSFSDTGKVDTHYVFPIKIDYRDSIFSAPQSPGNKFLWYRDNNPILGAYSSRWFDFLPGTYKCWVTDINNCVRFSNAITLDEKGYVLGFKKPRVNINNDFLVYPNPFDQKISLEPNDPRKSFSIQLVDASGKLVLEERKTGNCELNIPLVPRGNYLLLIQEEGGELVFKKLMHKY